ncbi:chemotaxis protein CheW [Hydrocarboniphaga sp.]|uniref:chemotaxis protein CheW n=1 Tax=Hydrocarboniphaga sp. TaxID=2033016 RepID=UPI003D13714E
MKPNEKQQAPREYLSFTLGAEEYGIDILAVQEIRGYDAVTRIPDAPEYIKGLVNLRGTIAPVVDLRLRFKLGRADYDHLTVMIVLNVADRIVGVVVDSVCDVVPLSADQIAPPPAFGSTFDSSYLQGLASLNERMLILVDIEKLLGSADMALYAPVAPALAA